MIHIRPYQLFEVARKGEDVVDFRVKMPGRYENRLIDTFCLLAAARIVNASRIWEFGTFRGATTLNLAMNFPGLVTTFDTLAPLPAADGVDRECMDIRFKTEAPYFEDLPEENQIIQVYGDSREFKPAPDEPGTFDLVFVDGGHDYETLKCDTENALRLVSMRGCIAWHDYGVSAFPELTEYLNVLSGVFPLVHIEETPLVLCFQNPDVLAELLGATSQDLMPRL